MNFTDSSIEQLEITIPAELTIYKSSHDHVVHCKKNLENKLGYKKYREFGTVLHINK